MCMSALHACMHIMYVPVAHRGQKRMLEPLELKLEMVGKKTVGCRKVNLVPLQEQQGLLASEAALQSLFVDF